MHATMVPMAKPILPLSRDAKPVSAFTKFAKVDQATKEYFKSYFKDTDFGDELVRDIEAKTAERLVVDAHERVASSRRIASTPSPAAVDIVPFAVTKLANGNVALEGAARVVTATTEGPVTSRFFVQASFTPKGDAVDWTALSLGSTSKDGAK